MWWWALANVRVDIVTNYLDGLILMGCIIKCCYSYQYASWGYCCIETLHTLLCVCTCTCKYVFMFIYVYVFMYMCVHVHVCVQHVILYASNISLHLLPRLDLAK